MKIAVMDADLVGRKKQRFPNLACEKISGYWKDRGEEVDLVMDYDSFDDYDQVFISKVFTDTYFPENIVETDRIHKGGTGFYFDKAPSLQNVIEHHMPDYNLYDKWIEQELANAKKMVAKAGKEFDESYFNMQFKEYKQYSIGFITRGCFRHCGFCVNKRFNRVLTHSAVEEFYNAERKKLCFLDDNFLGSDNWRASLENILELDIPFRFKQGLDERLLTDESCKLLFSAKYDGDYTFAFDNVDDYKTINSKLELIRKYDSTNNVKFYVLVGFKSTDAKDIENAFKRIKLLMQYKCLTYVMRYQDNTNSPWKESKYRGMYVTMARWCNQPSIYKKMSFRQFCEANQALHKSEGKCSSKKAMDDFEKEYPTIAKEYFDMRYEDFIL